jgi:hypothetical protein
MVTGVPDWLTMMALGATARTAETSLFEVPGRLARG